MCIGCIGNLFGSVAGLNPVKSRREFIAESVVATGLGAAALLGAAARPARAAGGGADMIFQGGRIIPLVGSSRYVEAVAISGGKIVAVGSNAEIAGLKTSATQVVNLDGRVLLPGFIDPHQHTVSGALITTLFAEGGFTTYATKSALLQAIKDKAAQTQPGQWLYWTNYDNLLQGGDLTGAEIDAVAPVTPTVVLYNNMHTATASRAAFTAARIHLDIGELPGGGRFGRGANGTFDGMIYEEAALKKFLIGLPPITPEFAGKAVLDWLKTNAAAGNTTVHEPGLMVIGKILEGYEKVAAVSPCRASLSLMFESMKEGERYAGLGRGARATQLPDRHLSLYGIKILGDGSNQSKTGGQTLPYLGGSDKGSSNFDAAHLKSMVAEVKAAGWPVLIHANGDHTLDIALDAIEAAYGANPVTGVNRIEHCTITRPEQIARMKALGVQPSFLMNHVHLYGAAYRDQLFGLDRAGRMDPAADCVKAGLPFTFHTDAPVTPIGTLQLIETAVTRRCIVDGSTVGADQAVSVEEALKANTIYAAGQIGMSDRLGTLERGKEADFTILESDPFKVEPNKINAIRVSQTYVEGKKMFG